MADAFLAPPKPPPNLNIPQSTNTVKVSCIDSTSRFRIPMGPFLQPDYTGQQDLSGPSFSFLIQHPSSKPILFDLGIRKDWHVLPTYPKWVEKGWYIHVEKDPATILQDHGIDVPGGAIAAILWSHHHWDHVGDASTFPSSTDLVVGPGFSAAHRPGYPDNPHSTLLQTDFAGRHVRDVDIRAEGQGLKIGRFHAYDYFGDGSFYLLDTPGHSIGHMCGLARTTTAPDTFVFMGGDAAHHGGEFRPTEYLPLPKDVQPSPLRRRGQCPGHLVQDIHPDGKADKPFYRLTETFPHDRKVAEWTLDGLGEFDAQENVLMVMAHDDAVVDPAQMEFYPKTLNDWQEKGTKAKVRWLFLGDFEEAVEAKEKGEKAFVWA